jgi:hypothetical protein
VGGPIENDARISVSQDFFIIDVMKGNEICVWRSAQAVEETGFDIISKVNALFFICLIKLHAVKASGLCGEENLLPVPVIVPWVFQLAAQ